MGEGAHLASHDRYEPPVTPLPLRCVKSVLYFARFRFPLEVSFPLSLLPFSPSVDLLAIG